MTHRTISLVTENDKHGSQHMAYKTLKFSKSKEWDTANINAIKKKQWIKHYKKLWFNEERTIVETEDIMNSVK